MSSVLHFSETPSDPYLCQCLQGVGDDFERLSEAGDCEAQLHRLATLEERLDAQRPPLAEAEARAENLCELLSDAASRSEVRARLGSAQKLYNGLSRKISELVTDYSLPEMYILSARFCLWSRW